MFSIFAEHPLFEPQPIQIPQEITKTEAILVTFTATLGGHLDMWIPFPITEVTKCRFAHELQGTVGYLVR